MAFSEPRPQTDARSLAAIAWASVRELIDLQLSPLGLRAMAALQPMHDQRVDIGCGAGQTVLQLADAVGPFGKVIGIDIAPRLLDIARARAASHANVSFLAGDAQTIALPTRFDAIFSRFGVMAFADPVAAFANFRRALRPGGRVAFVCWRSLAENELDHLPLRAAGLEAAVDLTPFTFEDPARILEVLGAAQFEHITIEPNDQTISCGGLDATVAVVTAVGALGKILRETPSLRTAAEPLVRQTLALRDGPNGVTLRAATWIVTARA